MIERQRPQSKVSLEDLLRLKRAERPEHEFWAQFEDQLRRKQLAAIVDKRPWWRRLSAASIARISIPVGATAVVAFTLLAVTARKPTGLDSATLSTPAVSPTAVTSVSSDNTTQSTLIIAGEDTVSTHETDARSAANISDVTSLVNTASAHRSSPENSNGIVAVQTASEPSLAQVILGLAGTSEAGEALPQYQTGQVSLLASADIWDTSRSEAGASIEASSSTSKILSPRDDRRARLLASVDAQDQGDLVSGNPRVAKSRDRIANRLAEQSLYDSISRLGLNGDSVSIKF